jgi:hypothetical protein
MGFSDALSRFRVRVMDGLVSLVARRSVRTTARPEVDATPVAVAEPTATPTVAPPTATTTTTTIEPPARTAESDADDGADSGSTAKTPEAVPRVVVVARDPDTAFVHWSDGDVGARLELRWLAGERVVRVEEVDAFGKQFLPFVDPNATYVAVLGSKGDGARELARSDAVVPPPAAPRAAGPERRSHPTDPNLEAIAEAQERARAQLPRRSGEWWSSASSSRFEAVDESSGSPL